MEIVETTVFSRQITSLLSDDEYRVLQSRLMADPASGVIIRGGRGIRKIRVGVGSRGKSGGARIVYFWAVRKHVILMLYVYAKNAASDLTAKQILQLAALAREEFGNESQDV